MQKIKMFGKKISNTIHRNKGMILLLFLSIILVLPVNYYIIIGGNISDIDSRILVEDENNSKGSFNISFVTEIRGEVFTYLLSYIIPSWELDSIDNYKYEKEEVAEEIAFRESLDLKVANSTAIKYAYQLAGKQVNEVNNEIYITAVWKEYNSKLKIGDQLLSINGNKYKTILEYIEYLQTLKSDDIVKVKILRNGKEKIIETGLHQYDNHLILGISLEEYITYETDPKIEIKFNKNEMGPSAGLITTLAIYDKLTKKDLTKSLKIAGTGTIEKDGSIGQIGGVKYKLLGAAKGKADIFLVPIGKNYEECLSLKQEKNLNIKIIGVETIKDAIQQLQSLKG